MFSELPSDTVRRARLHAALGDAVRLTIADLLAVADASPGELAAVLDLPTNLLAHHLNVLVDAGILRRVRSEGDRRRSYLRLRIDDPVVAALTTTGDAGRRPVRRVVFVCTRNSARSQLAAAIWQQISLVPATSAGTRPSNRVHRRAVAVGALHGLDLRQARTARLEDVLLPDDLVVAVCDNAHEGLPRGDRLHWAVPDPARRDTDEAFEATYHEIITRIDCLVNAVAPATTRRSTP